MNRQLLIFGISLILFSCFSQVPETINRKNHDVVVGYYKAYNSKDYSALTELISDDITLVEMNYEVLNTKAEFVNLVEWGEVFNSKNEMGLITEENGNYIVEETQDSERIQFLYGQELKARTIFTIENGKICKLVVDLINFDANKMNKNRIEFMSWVKENHPDKLKTINLLNKIGGQTFKEAMNLFESKK